MRAFVTGGAGFVGSALVDRLLAEGYEVDVVDDLSTGKLANLADARSEPEYQMTFHHLDIREAGLVDLMRRRRPDVVFHLAGQTDAQLSLTHPALDAEINVAGTVNVIEGARQGGAAKVVFASSGAIYGDVAAADLPVREGHPRRPVTPYGVGLDVVAEYLAAYRERHNLEYTILALANVYGPRQDPGGEGGVAATFAQAVVHGQPATVLGDGEQTRDLVFVDDAVDAFARAATRGGGLLINVGTGSGVSINALYDAVVAAAGVEPASVLHEPARPYDIRHAVLDPGRAAIQLGWRPWTALADGLTALLDWFRARPD